MFKSQITLFFIVLFALSGCEHTHRPTAPESGSAVENPESPADTGDGGDTGGGAILPDPEAKLKVVENCETLRDALDRFAALNGGEYPATLHTRTARGATVVDLLPEGLPLVNPFTGERNLPLAGDPAGPGDIGFTALWCNYVVNGYAISAYGADADTKLASYRRECSGTEVEIVGRHAPTVEDRILENCFLVRAAAEAFAAENGGEYPRHRDDTSLAGHTLIDLLPGGTLLTNPVTSLATEPGIAPGPSDACPYGSTYYECLMDYNEDWNYVRKWYRVTGCFDQARIVVTNGPGIMRKEKAVVEVCKAVVATAEAFAANNGGVYALNTGTSDPNGDVLIDYLPDGRLLEDPFLYCDCNPVNGSPTYLGQVGYLGFDVNNDGICGYTVEGLGARADWTPIYRHTVPEGL